jgi:hypothetical protein
MNVSELVLDCLRVGLDGEKVDYKWKKIRTEEVVLEFEDGRKARIMVREDD